ncbi:MAG: phage major capsid protein [Hyphomicrobiales bacterium]|nr:phage major capsid protein [Hyphomicrobiales bacterium]
MELKTAANDIAGAVDDLHHAFAAFRETNDTRLDQLEQRLSADVLTEEKLARIDNALDETKARMDRLMLERGRPGLGRDGSIGHSTAAREHKAAFLAYMRSGESGGLKALEEKTLSAGSGPDGGYLVPQPTEREILQRMVAISPIRSIASVREISTATFRKAFSASGPAAGWVAETDPRPQSASQQLSDLTFPAMELYAMPAATQTLLDDAAVDVEQWIAEEIDAVFAEQESAAFVNGDGVNKPSGILNYPRVDNASWSWGSLGYTATGVAGDFAASDPADVLVDLVYSARAGYRQNARFLMNRKTQAAVRKLKTSAGDYIWAPPAGAGQQATLMNFSVVESEDMPDIAADAPAIVFGDFQRGYLIVDRMGIRILRDPYSAKPYVLFYTTKRVGGGVQDFDAIKLLKFGVS